MKFLKMITVGALGVWAYKSWQRQTGPAPTAVPDDRRTTPPHGDPLMGREVPDVSSEPRPVAPSTRGIGDV